MTNREFSAALAAEVAATIGALIDVPCAVAASEESSRPGVLVQVAFTGPLTGRAVAAFDGPGAALLGQLVLASENDAPESAVGETLQEICTQSLAALARRQELAGLRVVSAGVGGDLPDSVPEVYRLQAGTSFEGLVSVWAAIDEVVYLGQPASAAPVLPANLEMILDIDLPLAVRFGETELTLAELTRLSPGAIIDLGRAPEEPVDVLVNGRMVARGEVVVVAGNYGIRITEVISAADRLKTVAA